MRSNRECEEVALMTNLTAEPVLLIAGDGAEMLAQHPWEPWFAWHPVRLYMDPRYIWMRYIYRRCVRKFGIEHCEYTDSPDAYRSKGPGTVT
jgi:hypothetical protein